MMTDSSKAAVWDDYLDPYGVATPLGTDTVSLDLRYPGQWLQPETGNLAQNWFRDYDPSLGRYTEADPLGIEAGQNLYGYVRAAPLSAIDSIGLCDELCKERLTRLRRNAKKLIAELRKYDPIADATGGFSMGFGRGFTVPGGHYEEILNLQSGLKQDLTWYFKNCLCDKNQKGPDPCPPYPKWIDDMANRPIQQPSLPTTLKIQPLTPAEKQATTASILTTILIGAAALVAF